MPRNDDLSLILAKAKRSGFFEDVKNEELDSLQAYANNLFAGDDVLTSPNRLSLGYLPKWRAAIAKVRKGDSDAKLLFVGDSTTGQTSTIAPAATISSYVCKFMDGFNSLPFVNGLALPPVGSALTNDTRWTAGAGWPASRNHGFAQMAWQAASPGGSLVYADNRINADRFDIYYLQNTGFGTITATATGGAGTPVATAGAVAINKATISAGSASTSNTLTLTATGTVYVVAIEPWLSTTRKVRVGNVGVPSSTSGSWVLSNNDFGAVPSIKKYAPDLTIIMLGINDSLSAVAEGVYSSNIQQLITAAQISGDVILATPLVGNGEPYATWVPKYGDALRNQVALPVLDTANRVGTWSGPWTTAGFVTDQTHPNELGNTDIASFIASALKSIT